MLMDEKVRRFVLRVLASDRAFGTVEKWENKAAPSHTMRMFYPISDVERTALAADVSKLGIGARVVKKGNGTQIFPRSTRDPDKINQFTAEEVQKIAAVLDEYGAAPFAVASKQDFTAVVKYVADTAAKLGHPKAGFGNGFSNIVRVKGK